LFCGDCKAENNRLAAALRRCTTCAPAMVKALDELWQEGSRTETFERSVSVIYPRDKARWLRTHPCRHRAQKRECQSCGDSFTPKRSDARFCSATCRQRAHRAAQWERGLTGTCITC